MENDPCKLENASCNMENTSCKLENISCKSENNSCKLENILYDVENIFCSYFFDKNWKEIDKSLARLCNLLEYNEIATPSARNDENWGLRIDGKNRIYKMTIGAGLAPARS